MGKIITLLCDETPGLKLGPGLAPGLKDGTDPANVIVFALGSAQFDEADYPQWRQWVAAKGTPHIEVIEGDDGQVAAALGLGFDCPTCAADGKSKSFASQKQLNGHRLSHVRATVPA